MKRYNPSAIEPKWQQQWAETKIAAATDFADQQKYVMLTEFPYPSGDGLHLGHTREYTLGDVMARFKRMEGFNVLYPMGFDAFGLPTENYAIKNKIPPQLATERNIANFRKQFDSLGLSIDWDRSFSTTDPAYYKWTQWLFLQFFKAGLAYQDKIAINWCPHCKTGLANEEVANGRHERCDTLVEKKLLKQWMLKITAYADRLIDGLAEVDFPSRIADQQINWIGRSVGAEVDFAIDGSDEVVRVFTTRADTIFGVSFIVLAPEHPLVDKITTSTQKAAVNSYRVAAQSKSEIERQDTSKEKTGEFTGAFAIHPITGEQIKIWVADYVLAGYGTGAVMGVPGSDERDAAFAQKYELPVTAVVADPDAQHSAAELYTGEGLLINSGQYNGLATSEAREQIVADLQKEGKAQEKVTYKLRDWIFSRQHYWGEPIPIIHCPVDGAVAVPEDQLPIELPPVDHYEPTETGESPLAAITDWVQTTCPKCGKPAQRETDTMPNWAGSSWYYLRYFDAHNDDAFVGKKQLDYWQDIDLYLGGMEHTTLHLLYSRFWHQFMYDQGLVPTPEPYRARRGQGIVLAADGSKMSKSKGNVINPSEVIDQGYGADALRLSIAFLAPYDQTTPWNPEGVAGTYRFLQRVWTLTQEHLAFADTQVATAEQSLQVLAPVHKTIQRVTTDLQKMSFNTAIAALMECVNTLYKAKTTVPLHAMVWQEALGTLLQLLAPFAPHVSEELWAQLGNTTSVHKSAWPRFKEAYVQEDMVTIVVQVNGKVRAKIAVEKDAPEAAAVAIALEDEAIERYLDGNKSAARVVFVPNRLINFVVQQ